MAITGTQALLQRLDKASGQGLDLDRLPDPTNIVRSLVRSGRAHISFGRLYVSRRCVEACDAEGHVEVAP